MQLERIDSSCLLRIRPTSSPIPCPPCLTQSASCLQQIRPVGALLVCNKAISIYVTQAYGGNPCDRASLDGRLKPSTVLAPAAPSSKPLPTAALPEAPLPLPAPEVVVPGDPPPEAPSGLPGIKLADQDVYVGFRALYGIVIV